MSKNIAELLALEVDELVAIGDRLARDAAIPIQIWVTSAYRNWRFLSLEEAILSSACTDEIVNMSGI
jgi:hypothetical protein